MPSPASDKKQRAATLAAEYARVSTTIQAQESQSDKILNIGVTIVSLSAAAGVSQKVYGIFFLVPLAVIAISLYTLMTYFYIQSLAGYKRHIEDLVNQDARERLLLWEQIVQRRERANLVRKTLLVSYGVIATGLIAASGYYVYCYFGVGALTGLLVTVAAFLPFLVLSGRDLLKVNDDTYRIARAIHAEPLAIKPPAAPALPPG